MRNLLLVLSGPSGVGKGTIAKELVSRDNFQLSISCTTRNPRVGEENGREYFFIKKEEFIDKINNNGLLEYSEHFDNYYGTPKDFVLDKLKDQDVLLEIDVNGGLKVKENYPNTVLIMIAPPSVEEVRKRLLNRNTETIEKIEERLSRIDYELGKSSEYDYTVINGNLEDCILEIENIIKKEKLSK
ncbi:MAG: guanylate kinase [Firmicutes bacterium]|nr:guanylate kinase [Candidatus Caballimonas caccae]